MIRRAGAALLFVAAGGAAGAALEVGDDAGRQVQLERPARRIVTLAPHATELVVAAGAGDRLVAIAAGPAPPSVDPGLPRLGGPGRLDRERLLALRPDLVIGWASGNQRSDLDWLAGDDVALFLSEPRAPGDVAGTLRAIGRLAGTAGRAEHAARAFERAMQTACADLPLVPVYVRVWERPALSLGGRHWLNALLRLVGYRNVLERHPHGIMHMAPEATLAYTQHRQISLVRRFDDSAADRLADLLSRPGPRLAEAVDLLCRQRLRDASATARR